MFEGPPTFPPVRPPQVLRRGHVPGNTTQTQSCRGPRLWANRRAVELWRGGAAKSAQDVTMSSAKPADANDRRNILGMKRGKKENEDEAQEKAIAASIQSGANIQASAWGRAPIVHMTAPSRHAPTVSDLRSAIPLVPARSCVILFSVCRAGDYPTEASKEARG